MSAPSHKRRQVDREVTFRGPDCKCMACYDTGIVANGDGLVGSFLPDYDVLEDGLSAGGSDLALICHCAAAYPQSHGQEKPRAGYREASGQIHLVDGKYAMGSEIPRTAIDELHRLRSEAWQQTAAEMNRVRQARAHGDLQARPWFVEEVREALIRTAQDQARSAAAAAPVDPGGGDPAPVAGQLQSLGSCLGALLSSPGALGGACADPPLELEPTAATDGDTP
ncbi:hypothetical protein KBZ18_10030 [Synechococcus sp. Cruz-9H2]|uniref:hypothetical protein n=1 Tax=unclassified Synechococcus TaxID=2626047 RepID=UPI0020CCA87D|nr:MULTISPECIES: hypothetical protein [unclassified Synechococcus]MCP9819830.1 hypothetical protein [Synechococcus sp. Cruz-9H2]MCP9844104.1 hypothetical protein [Synechococcus sp. Edmonson 11F2]MCP9856260.1 hypothetical protein [Synechococcus sp. Cruz-9C9]MCP9863545.1 hypothetical protein [Synechococcus sp. Cruz-7E5]MCP9870741.1 hypothetical protein [Synechococcus sp. Cruz-7B9]